MVSITPKGTAQYPQLHKPSEAYNIFGVNLLLSGEEGDELAAALEKQYEELYAEELKEKKKTKLNQNDRPWVREEDDEGNETGNWVFKFKMSPTRKRKGNVIQQRPQVVDAKRNPMSVEVWGGSIIKVGYNVGSYFVNGNFGVKLYLQAVQVLELKTGGNAVDAFDDEEGYEAAVASDVDDNDNPEW